MKIEFLFLGKTAEDWIEQGCNKYLIRIKRYVSADITIIPVSGQNTLPAIQRKKEYELILKKISSKDLAILLDENGKQFTSEEFSIQLRKYLDSGKSRIVFITGGSYGADTEMKKKADILMSFSKMTFTHQMVRPFLLEQTYRAFTILKNEKYHH